MIGTNVYIIPYHRLLKGQLQNPVPAILLEMDQESAMSRILVGYPILVTASALRLLKHST